MTLNQPRRQMHLMMMMTVVFLMGLFQSISGNGAGEMDGNKCSMTGEPCNDAQKCCNDMDVCQPNSVHKTTGTCQDSLKIKQGGKIRRNLRSSGAVYTRWGSHECPRHSNSSLVYLGVIAGAHYSHVGGAGNALCLPLNAPNATVTHNRVTDFASLYGSEYEVFPQAAHNRDGACAVCMSSRPQTMMVPATYRCPPGWINEYSGFIMAGSPNHFRSGTEYICVDYWMDGLLESERTNGDGMLLYYTKIHCGTLPCPPFYEGQIVSCVVCAR